MKKLRFLRYPRNPVEIKRALNHLSYLLREKEEEALLETTTLIQMAQQKTDQALLTGLQNWIKKNRLRIRG